MVEKSDKFNNWQSICQIFLQKPIPLSVFAIKGTINLSEINLLKLRVCSIR